MKWLQGLWAAFFTDAHVQALKNLADKNADGKVDLKDVAAEIAAVKADLKTRQASYWNALALALVAFGLGAFAGHKLL